jgi:hypothetical protein
MENPTAADASRNFWSMFEEASQEVRNWPEWKKEIQVGIYSEEPEAICPSPDVAKTKSRNE